ncbi:MAG: RNase J family beta-CASP ribonuclease [Nanoarchaeota archaeon]|nr:RNase J family beta-CASP ribonuclease [Nanoarchaeota archaeon]
MLKITAIGGYNEVGKNMTAVHVDEEIIILDMGLHLESYIRYTEEEDLINITRQELRKVGAIPDDTILKNKDKVSAIIPTHAHLDHVGAMIFMAEKYKAPIICTPYTNEVIRQISQDEKIELKNEIKVLNVNSTIKLSKNITIEFINMTHSTPQTVMVAIHTKYGIIIYANDFKLDNHPMLGKKPNYQRLEELGKEGVTCLICDSTRAERMEKTPSELVAKEMLRDVLLGVNSKGKAVIVTTFSSHIARLKSILEFGHKMNRKTVFLGRSLAKYIEAAENIDLVHFSKEAEIVKFGDKVRKRLKKISKEGADKYLLVVTGHQGEQKATLSRVAKGEFEFKFKPEDHVVFSCTVIPSEINIENRKALELELESKGIRIFKDIHTSGHASREDLRDLLNLVNPKHLIPAHGNDSMKSALASLAAEKGFKNIHIMHDGDTLTIQ